MITKISIPIEPKPKPRGQLGRYGNITHSLGGYREWQNKLHQLLSETDFQISDNFYGFVFQFNLAKKRGHPPDLSNLQGGVEDVLVKYKYIKDDNWKILNRFYTFGKLSIESSIILYIVESKKELLHVVEKYTD